MSNSHDGGITAKIKGAVEDVVQTAKGVAGLGREQTSSYAPDRESNGQITDDAMTRSEEQMRVGAAREETGKARLVKEVVTEEETHTIPVSHEEVRVEREPVTEVNRDEATAGRDISEGEHEVTLHAERPVVEKEAVPVERVKLDTETVTDQAAVSGEVRKEQINIEGDVDSDRS